MSDLEKEQAARANERWQVPPEGEEGKEAKADEAAKEAPPPPADNREVVQLKAELEAARKRIDELARAFQSLTQDREEFKQRLTRERERMLDVERGNVALMLLEAIDELDLCLSVAGQDKNPLAEGVRLIRDGLVAKLQANGIERLSLVGQAFDPNVAEAADIEVTPNPLDDQKVVAETRAGYRMKNRVIRPARVKVARYVAPAKA
jgi:molecular chaperone GrpE